MPATKVDLRTRILPTDHAAYVARPGKKARLYSEFIDHKVIGPELPGVVLDGGKKIKEHKNIDELLKKSAAIRAWASDGRPEKNTPPDALAQFKSHRKPPGHGQFVNLLEGFFEEAKKGDIVIVPPDSYVGNAAIAEFLEKPEYIHYVKVEKFGDFALPVRKIKILGYIQKRELPQQVLNTLATKTSLFLVGGTEKPFIYEKAYGGYVIAGNYTTQMHVSSRAFNIEDNLLLTAFIKFVAENTKRITYENNKQTLSIHKAAFVDLADFAPSLKSNINSPGFLSLQSPYIIPLVAAVLLTVAIAVGAAAPELAEQGMLLIGNSSAPANDACTAQVHEAAIAQLRLYRLDGKWPEACEFARKLAQETGLTPQPIATVGK